MKIVSEPVDMIAKFTSAGDRGEKNGEKPVPCKFRYTDIAGISREVRIDRIISADPGIFGGVRGIHLPLPERHRKYRKNIRIKIHHRRMPLGTL